MRYEIYPILAIGLLISIVIPAYAYYTALEIDFLISQNDSVEFLSTSVVERERITPSEQGSYTIRLLDNKGNILVERNFDVSFERYGTRITFEDIVPKTLVLPYSSDIKKIVLLHNNKIIFKKEEMIFCNNNSKCEQNENYLSCPSDCPSGSKDGYCDEIRDGKCDPDCASKDDYDCHCGDGKCDTTIGENLTGALRYCPKDCGCPAGSTLKDDKCVSATKTPTEPAMTIPQIGKMVKDTPTPRQPAFEVALAILCVIAIAYLATRKKR